MAWNNVTYACGHVCQEQLYGKIKKRDWYIEKALERDCPTCWKKKQTEAAKKEAEKEGLPKLEGTEKQIAWAETIRIKMLDEMYKLIGELIRLIESAEKIFLIQALNILKK